MWRPGPADRWHPTLCDGAAARGSLPTFGIHARTDACTQVGASGRWSDFRPSRNGDGAAPGWRAQSERVWESAGATAQAVFRPLVSVHTPTPASILARLQAVDGKIFDHPETMMGLRRLARTDFEKVRAGHLLTLRIRSCRCLYACWRGRSTRPTLEHREAVVGRFPRRRKVCESVGERRCDVAGSLVTFSSRLHRRLHTSWRGWWGLDRFSGIVKWCCDCAGCRAQSARVSGSDVATAQAVSTG